ncbi:prefoldin subunit 5 [Raphidocelis subcapitata]|uniref:Prefoldin subunit 5 n=1 Tax=Raphidocelis subcapitata TaxID=307507 RepID=A0A2V0P808_9CHLO|nr:prefoldin subunit 5 [Raphidocelis subcapitata]|eukprot:GBF93990.1 prefoldin subunit 5 [Raphidocelis subcapitata]
MMSASPSGGAAGDHVPVTALSAQELAGVRDNVESACNELAEKSMHIQRLMAVFSTSNRTVQALADSQPGQPLMIPLTESLYVPAKLADSERVLLNIGTGYFVQVGTDAASDYCRRRSAKLEDLLKNINQDLAEKRNGLAQIEEVLNAKIIASRRQEQQQQQQQQQRKAVKAG